MDEPRPVSIRSPIVARAQKIRERMAIEVLSGVPASRRELFLPLCLQYEQEKLRGFADALRHPPDEAFGQRNGTEYKWRAWEQWDDWHKFVKVK